MLLGRGDERARINRMLACARHGVGGALIVLGESGIGKSALLEYARGHAEGMQVASVHDPASPSLLSSAAIGLLNTGLHTQPLLVVIDDAHLLDARCAVQIASAAQHLGNEPAALLLAADDGGGCPLPGLEELRLQGLDRESTRGLLAWLWGCEPGQAALAQLHTETGGNPLALRELSSLLRKTQITGKEPLASPIPVGARVGHAFLRPVQNLPKISRAALLVVAAAGVETTATLATALQLLDGGQADAGQLEQLALGPATEAGIVEPDGHQVRFCHPITRSAVYHHAPTRARRAAHLALARALLPDPDTADRRAWHTATATATLPGAAPGAAVEAAALQAYSRQQYTVAAQGLELAANLFIQGDHRARCLLRAASSWHLVGRSQYADQLLDQALTDATDPQLRADLVRLRGRTWTWTGRPAEAHQLLLGQVTQAEEVDPRAKARTLVDAGLAALLAGDGQRAASSARRAERLAATLGGATARAVAGCAGAIRIACGDAASASPLVTALSSDEISSLNDSWIALTACALIWLERYETAERALNQIVAQARAQSAPALLPVPLALLAECAFRTGRWEEARTLAAEAADVGERVGQPDGKALGLGCLARLDAARGMALRSRSRAAEVERLTGSPWSRPQATAALGLLALGIGETHEAIRHLEAARAMLAECGLRDPSVVQWAPDLVEAYTRAGRIADARRLLEHLQSQAERTERTWALAATARCHGLLACDAEFEYHFAAAFRWHDRTETPFEWARTALCLGARLRHAGRNPEARVHLRAALIALEQLGATPWAQRARAELRLAGEQANVRSWADHRLTRKEAEVAWLVAQGQTNREVANTLGVTPRTIGFHLGNIYRKLDIGSRTDLPTTAPASMLAG